MPREYYKKVINASDVAELLHVGDTIATACGTYQPQLLLEALPKFRDELRRRGEPQNKSATILDFDSPGIGEQ
jgi:hypothetical protein